MVKWELIRPKDWIAIVDEVEEPSSFGSFDSYFSSPRRRLQGVNGKPLQVVAMSFPFIAVTDGVKRVALDYRRYELRKLDRKYVEAMRGRSVDTRTYEDPSNYLVEEPGIARPDGIITPSGKRRRKKKEDRRGHCPRCGNRMVELLVDVGTWVLKCKECGFQGGNPSGEVPPQ